MKSFSDIRESTKKMPAGKHVFGKKVKGINIMVHKQGSKFITYVDNEKLDSFMDLESAKKAGLEFVKQYKG